MSEGGLSGKKSCPCHGSTITANLISPLMTVSEAPLVERYYSGPHPRLSTSRLAGSLMETNNNSFPRGVSHHLRQTNHWFSDG